MAISYLGGLTAQITAIGPSTQSISLTSLGLATGDLVIVSYGEGAGGDVTMSGKMSTSGYTFIAEGYADDTTGYDANLALFYKVMGSTVDTSVVVLGGFATTTGPVVIVQAWRGVNTSNPFDATTTAATGVDGGNVNPPAITPVTSGNVLTIFGSSATANTESSTYTTASTSYMTGFLQTQKAGSARRGVIGAGYVADRTAGVSYNPAAWALSPNNTDNSWVSNVIALRPQVTIGLSPNNLITSAPAVQTTAITQTHGVSGSGVTLGIPSVQTASVLEANLLLSTSLVSGNPSVQEVVLQQKHTLLSSTLLAGSPTTSQSTLKETNNFGGSNILTGAPFVGASLLSRKYLLGSTSVVTGTPSVGTPSLVRVILLTSAAVLAGLPVAQATTLIQASKLLAGNLTTGNPRLGITTLNQKQVFSGTPLVAGNPTLGTLRVGYRVNLLADNVLTGNVLSSRPAVILRVFDPNNYSLENLSFVAAEKSRVAFTH